MVLLTLHMFLFLCAFPDNPAMASAPILLMMR
jgi:hypothetical protein